MAWGLGLSILLLGAPAGRATVRELLMQDAGLDPQSLASTPSVRLLGMGDLDLCVPDESNEMSAFDFGGNVAGMLDDGELWVVETWLGRHRQTADRSDFSADRRYGHGGVQVMRRWPSRAMGVDVDYDSFEDTEQDGDWSKIGGPRTSAIYNQRIGPVTAGLIVGREKENEARISEDFFTIRHSQGRWTGQFGLTTQQLGIRWGAGVDFERGDVIGKGIDPERYHEDTFTWARPVNRYSVFALATPRPGVEGGVRFRALDREGSESAMISWSGESPYNPSGTNYFADAVTFAEQESDWDLTTRWRVRGSHAMTLAAEAGYRSWDHQVREGDEFKGSLRAGEAEKKVFTAGAGISRRLMRDRVLVGLEAHGAFEDWVEVEALERRSEGTARRVSVGPGFEFFAGERLILRGGFSLLSDDANVDQPATLRTGHVLSAGLAWVPRGGLIQVQAAVRQERLTPDAETATDLEKVDDTQFLVGLRWLL
jgi:hypothetical protein